MKKILIASCALVLVACGPRLPPDAKGYSNNGANWEDLTSHYSFPKGMEGCKVHQLKSAADSAHPNFYVVDCGRPLSVHYKEGKLQRDVSVL